MPLRKATQRPLGEPVAGERAFGRLRDVSRLSGRDGFGGGSPRLWLE